MRTIGAQILCVGLFLSSCQHEEHLNHEESTYTITSPVIQDATVDHEYVCQIHSIQHIELRALEKGYLQNIYVDEGQRVKKGQTLFQIMPVIYQAEAQKAGAEVSFAEIEYRNTKSLADSQIVSANELALAMATLEKAKAEQALAQAHLSFTEIKAPFDGIVGRFNDVRLGSLVDEGELLTTLSDNSKMWVYYNVPEAEYLDYVTEVNADGSYGEVRLQMANNKLFDEVGIVETIEADFNNETGNIAFRATFQNPKKLLRHGETGKVLMPVKYDQALLIPQKATFEILDKRFVFVVGEDGLVQSRQIEIGAEMPHVYQVVEGLKSTDKILVEGLRKVKNKEKIKFEFVPQDEIIRELKELHAE